ncbi:unnamed protein product, partial [Amoebophrya sp. A25]
RVVRIFEGRAGEEARNRYACRVLQRLIGCGPEEMIAGLVMELSKEVVQLSLDQNGNHVIQKCFSYPALVEHVVTGYRGHILTVARHVYGCRVLQRLLQVNGERLLAKKEQ